MRSRHRLRPRPRNRAPVADPHTNHLSTEQPFVRGRRDSASHPIRALLDSRALAALLTAWTLGRLSVWSSTMLFGPFAHQIGGAPAVGAAMVARVVPAAVVAPSLALLATCTVALIANIIAADDGDAAAPIDISIASGVRAVWGGVGRQ